MCVEHDPGLYRVKQATLTRECFLDAGFDKFPGSQGVCLGSGD